MSAEVSFTKRAAAELSRCFNGLTVNRNGSKKQTAAGGASSSTAPSSPAPSVKEKDGGKANETTFLLTSKASSKSQVPHQIIGNSSQTLITKANTTISPLKASHQQSLVTNLNAKATKTGAQGPGTPSRRPPPPAPRKTSLARRKNYLLGLSKPRTTKDLWKDFPFLSNLFCFFTPKERTLLTQVSGRDIMLSTPLPRCAFSFAPHASHSFILAASNSFARFRFAACLTSHSAKATTSSTLKRRFRSALDFFLRLSLGYRRH